jgi:hypothetical protein
MQRIRLDLDQQTFERLARAAAEERRPIPWQAEVIIRRAVGKRATGSPPTVASEGVPGRFPSQAVSREAAS